MRVRLALRAAVLQSARARSSATVRKDAPGTEAAVPVTEASAAPAKQDRGILFMRSHFYLMAFLIPMSVLKDVFQLILGD